MKKNIDVFDTTNTDDISSSCSSQLRILRIGKDGKNVLDLFSIKNELSIDEIIIAMYRLHRQEKTRAWVSSTLYNFGRKGLIKKVNVKKGIYKKVLHRE